MTEEQLQEIIKKAALYDELINKEREAMEYLRRRMRAERKDLDKIAWFY